MATNGIKTFSIKINGIQESIDAVSALNKQLANLEQRINVLSSAKSVGTKVSGGGGTSSSSKSSLSEEEKLEKQIEQIDAKRVAYSKEIYQNYLAAKDILKETVQDQKQLAASERLSAGNYSNTMAGMKQELADIKSVMQTVDLGDTDQFDKLTQRANKLNDELKKIEESYGQFGRNVGNYQDAAKGLSVVIAGQTREFSNSRQALRSLKQELDSLSASERGNSSYAKELRREYNRLKSAIDDATKSSKFMDEALDMMQSFGAIGQVTQGFSTLFGLDGSEIERQIAKLVALQNALNGLEKIQKQIDSEEGVGKWIAKASDGIDKFVTKLTGAQKRMGLFIGETKQASIAINAFSKALKGIAAVGVIGGIVMLTNVVGELIDSFKKWRNAGIEVGKAEELLSKETETATNTFERLKNENLKNYFNNTATSVAYLKNTLNDLITQLKLFGVEVKKYSGTKSSFGLFGGINKDLATNLADAKKAYKEQLQLIADYEKKLKNSGAKGAFARAFDNIFGGGNQAKRNAKLLGKDILDDFLYRVEETAEKAQNKISEAVRKGTSTDEAIKSLKTDIRDLNQEANEDFAVNSVLNNVELFADAGPEYARKIEFVKNALAGLNEMVNYTDLNPDYLAQLKVDQLKGSKKIKAQNDLDRKREIAKAGGDSEVIKQINKKYDVALQESLKSINQQYASALADLNELRIQNMKESLAKELAQLKEERRQKIEAIKQDGNLVGARIKEVNELYRKKELDAQRDWAYEMVKTYEDMYSSIQNVNKENMSLEVSTANQNIQNVKDEYNATSLPWVSQFDPVHDLEQREVFYKKLLLVDESSINRALEIRKEELDKLQDYDIKEEELRHKRVADAETTALVMENLAAYESKNGVPLVPESADADWNKFEKTLQKRLEGMRGELVDAYNAGKLSFKDFVTSVEAEEEAHNSKMNALEKQYVSNVKRAEIDNLQERQQAYNNYYQNVISLVRLNQDKIADSMSKQPVKDNDWDIVQVNKTKENYKKLLKETENTKNKIVELKKQLKEDLKANKITAEDFFMRKSELDSAEKAAEETTKEVKEKQKYLIADFVQSIEVYLQGAMQSFNTIMNAVWDAQDNANDKEAERLDKLNEIIEQKLDEQEAIIDKHKNNIDSIEDELASARGDRRQHLIDQLNAEMQAQREAAAEQKRLQKEKEANERKQDELEKKRKKQQYHRDMIQAIVNGAMAVTMAAVNKWPIPAIPMMALAASTTAAQIAIMAANKPYAKGGLLEGPSHSQGGIPVGNTGIEVEGKEYVIRKSSTAPNIEILDYINKSERKLNLDDFIDFYSSGKLKKNIVQMSPRSRFANGGSLPTISTNYSFDDRLLTAFEDYSNRPVVVSVKDINDRQTAVRNVQVLAGLSD